MHTCKNSNRLRKKIGLNEIVCRFKYPKEIQHESQLDFFGDQLEYTPRHSVRLKSRNKFVLQHWRANMNIQAIVSVDFVLYRENMQLEKKKKLHRILFAKLFKTQMMIRFPKLFKKY